MDEYPIDLIAFAMSVAIHAVVTYLTDLQNVEHILQQLTINYISIDLVAMILSVVTFIQRFDRKRDLSEDLIYLTAIRCTVLNSTSKLQLIMGYNFASNIMDLFLSSPRIGLYKIQLTLLINGMLRLLACLTFPCLVYLITVVIGQNHTSTSELITSAYAYLSLCAVTMTVSRQFKQQIFQPIGQLLIVSSGLPVQSKIALLVGTIMVQSLLCRLKSISQDVLFWNEEDSDEQVIGGDHVENWAPFVNEGVINL